MIDNLVLAIDGAWKVLLIGLTLGAGLPVIFAFGVKAYAFSADETAASGSVRARAVSKVAAVALFAVVILGVLVGIAAIVASGFDAEITSIFG